MFTQKQLTRIFCFCSFHLILLVFLSFSYISPEAIYTNKANGFLKDARRISLCYVRWTTAKSGEMKTSLRKYV